ncbi:MAG: rhodanese-like domain-containing protein, partial [Gemmatimonadota bacterium]
DLGAALQRLDAAIEANPDEARLYQMRGRVRMGITTGGKLVFAEEAEARLVHHGDRIRMGNIVVEILHTPGHTPEHISFMITDGAAGDAPMGVLTGDFVFVGDVGRPDLLEKAAGVAGTMEESARTLYRSLERFRAFPGWLQILPGHGAGSACGKALGAVPTSTLGYELLVNWAFQCKDEEEFVRLVLEDQPEPPRYFATMKRLNRDGPPILGRLPSPRRMQPRELEPLLDEGGVVVDLRGRDLFAAGHVPGTLNIPFNTSFPNWAGWFLSYGDPVYFIADGQAQADAAARQLALIGIDNAAGFFDGETLERWAEGHVGLQSYALTDWEGARRAVEEEGAVLIDVRNRSEWNQGHVAYARHIHLGYLRDHLEEIPADRPVYLYCLSGGRSAIGASLLQAEGFRNVRNVEGLFADAAGAGLPVEREETEILA